MASSFGRYTGGIQPIQGINEFGAQQAAGIERTLGGLGDNIAESIKQYAKNRDMDDAATQELDSSAAEIARFAQSIQDIPEFGSFSEELNAKSEEILKARTGNRGAKLSAASNARNYTSKIGDSLNFYRGIQGIREQRAFNEGNSLPIPAAEEYQSDRLMSSKNFYSWDNKKTEAQNLQGLTGKYNELKSRYPNLRFRPIDEFINEWTANNVFAQDPNNSKIGTIDGFSVQNDSSSPVRKDDDSIPRHPFTKVKIITPEMLGMPASEPSVTRNPSRGSMLRQKAPVVQAPVVQAPAARVAPAPTLIPESLRPAPKTLEQAPAPEQNPVEAADSEGDLGYTREPTPLIPKPAIRQAPAPALAAKVAPAASPVATAPSAPVPEIQLPPEYYVTATEAPSAPVPESLPAPAAKKQPAPAAQETQSRIKPDIQDFVPIGKPTYTTLKGDSSMVIARKNGITIKRLMDANGLYLHRNLMKGGEKLYIPPTVEENNAVDRDANSLISLDGDAGESGSSDYEEAQISEEEANGGTPPVKLSANAIGEQKAASEISKTMAFHAKNNGEVYGNLVKVIDGMTKKVNAGDFSEFTNSTYDNWKLTQPEYYGGVVRPLEIIGEAGLEFYGGKLLGKLGNKLMPASEVPLKRISEFNSSNADATRPLLKGIQKELSKSEMLAQSIDNWKPNATNIVTGSRTLYNTVDFITHPDASLEPSIALYNRLHGGKHFIDPDTGKGINALGDSPVYQKYDSVVQKARGILAKSMGSNANAFFSQDFSDMTPYQRNVAKMKILPALEAAKLDAQKEADAHSARYESIRIKTPEEQLALARAIGNSKIVDPQQVLLNPNAQEIGNTEIEVAQQIESLPQTAQARRQQVMGFIKNRLGYVPLGFNDMYKKEHPEESLQFYQHPQLGAFYTDGGKDGWKPVPVVKNGITQKDIAEAKAVTFGTPTANGFQGEEFIKGSGYKLSGIGAFGTPTDASAFRESYRKLINAKIAVKQLDVINEKLGRSWNPTDWGQSAYLVSNLIAQMRVSLIGAGSVSDFEQKLLKELVQNPTDFFSLQSTTRSKYKTIIDKLNLDLETLPQAHGLTVEVTKDRKEQTAALREMLRQRESDAGYQKLTNNGRGVGAYSKLSPQELDAEQLKMDTEQSTRVQSPQR